MSNPEEDKTNTEVKTDDKTEDKTNIEIETDDKTDKAESDESSKIAEDAENTKATSDDNKSDNQSSSTPSHVASNIEETKDEDTPKQEEGDGKTKVTKEDCLKLLRESFDGYDYNGNGTVAHEEVREAYTLCQEEWKQKVDHDRCDLEATIFMKDIDKGGDGQVDFEEYVKYFRYLWLLSQGYDVSN